MKKNLPKSFLTCLLSLFSAMAFAQPGALDPSFSNDGKVWYDFGFQDNITDVAQQPGDDKILAVGTAITPAFSGKLLVLRMLADGSLDPSFGNNGSFILQSFNESYAYSVKPMADGSIWVAGTAANDQFVFSVLLLKLNANGTPDVGFGTNGVMTYDLGPADDFCYDMEIDASGRLLLAGKSLNESFQNEPCIVRINADGSIDTQFGLDGVARFAVMNEDNNFYRIALDAQGRIVVAGHYALPITPDGQTNLDMLVARYTAAGVLDASFGNGGYHIVPISQQYTESAFALDVDASSNVYVGGYTTLLDFSFDAILLKYDASGLADSQFGNAGIFRFDENVQDVFYDLKVGSDNKLYACGTTGGFFFDDRDFLFVRLNLDGSADNTWGENGQFVTTTIDTSFDEANALCFQSDGRAVLGGKGSNGTNNDAAFVRYFLSDETGITPSAIPGLSCSPNPVVPGQSLTIHGNNLSSIQGIQLLDLQGRLIWEGQSLAMSFTMPSTPPGTYLLRVITPNAVQTQKLVVQR
jgi:uncharacterized delta-60 repeat protein